MNTVANNRHNDFTRMGRCIGRWAVATLLAFALVVGLAPAATATILNITVVGNGDVVQGASIDCPDVSCSQNYGSAGIINMTATPDSGWYFAGWSGDTSNFSSTTSATTTINPIGATPDPRNVIATFKPKYVASIDSPSVDEDAGTVTMTVSLDRSVDSGETVIINRWTNSGSATSPADFTFVSSAVVITAGNSSGTYTIDIIDDALYEGNETFLALISAGSTNSSVGTSPGTVTIVDNDYEVSSITSPSAAEDAGSVTFTVTLNRTVDSGESVVLNYATSNASATAGSDYTAAASTLTIPAGDISGTITIALLDDAVDESDETFTVGLTAGSGNVTVPGGAGTGTGTITDDDYTFSSISSPTVLEDAGTMTFTVTLDRTVDSGDSVAFTYSTSDGTAAAGADYTAAGGTLTITAGNDSGTISVPILDDAVVESSETFTMTVAASSGNITLAGATGTGTITDDDYAFSSISSPTVLEDAGSMIFTVTLDRAVDTGDSVLLDYATSNGSAAAPGDYTASSGTLTITAGNDTGTISIPITDDAVSESSETFTVTLTAGGGNVTVSGGTGTGTITDDDYQFSSISSPSVLEDAGSMSFTVTLDRVVDTGDSVSLNYYTSNGSAVQPSDYTTTAGTLTITAGNDTGTITVPIIDDATPESDETFSMNLTASSGNITLASTAGTGTIINDDYSISSVSSPSAREDAGSLTFTVTLDRPVDTGDTVTLGYNTANSSAVAPGDYTAVSGGTATIPAGVQTVDITIAIVDDGIAEPDEIFSLVVWPTSGNIPLVAEYGVGTILNDDYAVTVSPASASVDEGSDFSITVSLDRVPTGSDVVTVDLATADGTATAGSDYTAVASTLTFNSSSGSSQTVTFATVTDTTVEPDETLTLTATVASGNATVSTSMPVILTIANDDTYGFSIANTGVEPVTEGAVGAVSTFTVTIDQLPITGDSATVNYSTVSGTAESGLDFSSTAGVLTFDSSGGLTQTVTVPILDDSLVEDQEHYTMTITAGTKAAILAGMGEATANINDDASDTYTVYIAPTTAYEQDGNAVFTVTTDQPVAPGAANALQLTYTTSDGSAVAPDDYTATSDTAVVVPIGGSSGTIAIPIVDDAVQEEDETFTLTLSVPVGTRATLGVAAATGTIKDNDFIVTINAGTGGTLHDVASDAYNTTFTQRLSWNADTTEVEAVATSSSGYRFVNWEITGTYATADLTDPNLIITGVQSDIVATAVFSDLYTVNFSASAGGTLVGDTSQTVAWGTATTAVEAVHDVAYFFDGWSGDASGTTNPLTIASVKADLNIQAEFLPDAAAGGGIGGCASATGSDNSAGFSDLTKFDTLNLDLTAEGSMKLQTGDAAIDPNSIIIPFEQEVFVTFLYEGAGYVSDFGWMYYEDAVNDGGTPDDKSDDTFKGWNSIDASAKRVLFRNIRDDTSSSCCNGGNGILDSDSGIGSFPYNNEVALGADTPPDGTDYKYIVDNDGVVTPKDMRKSLGTIPAGKEIIFWLTADRDYTTSDADSVYFNKRDWNQDTYLADCGTGTFTKVYHLGDVTSESCTTDGGWLASPAITRMADYFGITLSGTYDLPITRGEKYSHVIVGAPPDDPNQWILGWEDLFGGGDADHNDMVFRVERKTGGTAELKSSEAIQPLTSGGTPDLNSYYTAVTFEVFDHIPCGDETSIKYFVAVSEDVDGEPIWQEITDWDTILTSDSSRTKGAAVALPWVSGTPEYTYRSRRIDFSALGIVGRKLVWKAELTSGDEACAPEILGVNLRGSVATHASFSRATPVVQTNVIYSGSFETPLGTWVDKENRGHLQATRIYDPKYPNDPTHTGQMPLWDAGLELSSRDLSLPAGGTNEGARTIYTPVVSIFPISDETLHLSRSACTGTVKEFGVTIAVATTPASPSSDEVTIAKTYPATITSYSTIEGLVNYTYVTDGVTSPGTVTITKTTVEGTETVNDGVGTTTVTVVNSGGTSTITTIYFDGTDTFTDTTTQPEVTTTTLTNPVSTVVSDTVGDGCTTAFSGALSHMPLSATTLQISDSRETFVDKHTEDLESNFGKTGTINRATGAFSLTFDIAPGIGVPIRADYKYYTTTSALQLFATSNDSISPTVLALDDTEVSGTKIYDLTGEGDVDDLDANWLIDWFHGYKNPATGEQKEWLLGPIDHSAPAVLVLPGKPAWYFGTAVTDTMREAYDTYRDDVNERPTVLFVGSRDGMLHAFDAGHHSRLDSDITETIEEHHGHFRWKVVTGATVPDESLGEILAPPDVTVLKDNLVVPDGVPTALKTGESIAPDPTVLAPDYGTGKELWAFIPANLLPRLKNNYLNQEDRAFVDASPAIADALIDTDADGTGDTWKSILISSEGNGGDTVFCLDVTDPTTPTFMWEFSDPDLFRSRSSPAIAQIGPTNFAGPSGSPVLRWTAFFVTGIVEDPTLYPAIYMVDVSTGQVLDSPTTPGFVDGRIDLDDVIDIDRNANSTIDAGETDQGRGGVPSGQPAVIDSDGNGYLDRIYIGTTAGLLYKVNIPDVDLDSSKVLTGITHCIINTDYTAEKGAIRFDGTSLSDEVPDTLRFQAIYASPTVVVDNYFASGVYHYNIKVMFGTSDSPFYDEGTDTSATQFNFMVYIDSDEKTECNAATLDWFYQLPPGARVYSSAFAAAGKVYFGTSSAVVEDPCDDPFGSNAGRLYVFDIDTGQSEVSQDGEDGLATGNISTSPLIEDEQLYFKTADGLMSIGNGIYNNQPIQGLLSSPTIQGWFEILDDQ